ncbi:PadR family transcriptional regulator [Haloglycomyces albus]|uniref:PadR family transcriptional regulator n=1 Tax=Haloglycomyces albus TaxID=526067 RepID=UPI00046CF543|nr:PadR family transcriptional regulator [Haloglycomyces albus]
MLELAILGLLHESPMHGYELRKRLLSLLGAIRAAISYGSLYPTLRRMRQRGWIEEETPRKQEAEAGILTGRRARKVYRLTAAGKEHFEELMCDSGPESADEAMFGVHLAFFSRTDPANRLRILEARRQRVQERLERLSSVLKGKAERFDAYGLALQRYGLETAEREVRWLNELIASEENHNLGHSDLGDRLISPRHYESEHLDDTEGSRNISKGDKRDE